MSLTALIDGDVLMYRAGYAGEKRRKIEQEDGSVEHVRDVEPLNHVLHIVDTIVDHLPSAFTKKRFFLTGKGNFRHELATIQPYKDNRSPLAKPVHHKEIREFLIKKYGAEVIDDMEADDAMGIAQTSAEPGTTVIVSIDKDLLMIPGYHYDLVKGTKSNVGTRDANRAFYRQLLTGDRVDNIPGIDGIGPKRASGVIDQYGTEYAMWSAAKDCWYKNCPNGLAGKSVGETIAEVAALLWISRKDRERWSEPSK